MSISTVRAILKKFKATGRGHVYFASTTRMVEAKNSLKITVGELQRKVASWESSSF